MKMLINGAAGCMGGEMLRYAGRLEGVEACGVDITPAEGLLDSLWHYEGRPDVLVDFSAHGAIYGVLNYALAQSVPCVICTTGFLPEELSALEIASRETAVFRASNVSLGTAMFIRCVRSLAALFPQSDIEILETHRRGKADAPSGTALTIANAIEAVHPGKVAMHSLRMGETVGEHEVRIATSAQTIALRHTAHSRELFAEGAYAAARFMLGKSSGYYTMEDIIREAR